MAALTSAFSLAWEDIDVTVIGPTSVAELQGDIAALNPLLTAKQLRSLAAIDNHPNRYRPESEPQD